MRLCITKTTGGTTTVLHIDGELLGEGVRELERVALAAHPLRLDLTNLLRADTDGLEVLLQLAAAGADLVSIPPYFALLLERPSGS